ncbi:MAG: glycosyltransferase [Frankiales bacterium]|nr:glycosyltransferase [Frankiales bacterium]
MRVLVLGSTYPPHALGGYELSCDDVMTRWRKRGHSVEVLTTDLRVPGVVDVDEPHVHRDLRWYWDDHRLLTPPWPARFRLERHDQAALARALERKPDVVSVWSMGAMPLQLVTTLTRSGIPTVLVVCDDWLWYGPRIDPWTRAFCDHPRRARWAERLTGLPARLPDDLGERVTTVFVSERTRQAAEDRTPWTFPGATVVPSGIDLSDFPLVAGDPRPWQGRLLCVGRLDPRKGFATAVRALPGLPGCSLRIVGRADPQHRRELEAMGGAVTFDAVPRSELRQVYGAADALLFTSTWEEPFGLVPLEAMACGTPVVAVPSGGAADYLDDEVNALLVPAGDEAALAAAVRRLAGDEGLRARLVQGGLATAARYTTDVYADALEKAHLR